MTNNDEEKIIDDVLKNAVNIAVVGMSDDIHKDSFRVGMYLKRYGYNIIPVNPDYQDIKGIKSYASISGIPADVKIDVVNIFRRKDEVLPHVKEAIERGVGYIWMQKGISSDEAASLARSNGIPVIMNRCIMVEHSIWK